MSSSYRDLPSVARLLAHPALHALAGLPHDEVTQLIRERIGAARLGIEHGEPIPSTDLLAGDVAAAGGRLLVPSLRSAINATGVIIHTNLGRAPLSDDARAAVEAVARGYSNLEFELETGERGSRHAHLDELLRRVTGAEASLAVNNNAAALVLTLSALSAGREVVISRSQAIEIGGGFRIPDVMRQSGAALVEVGTTNRTYQRDFEAAINDATAALLRVHSSNFRITGFTAFPPLDELAELARRRHVLLFDDLGSGCLLPVEPYGLVHEPLVQESIAAGANLALFSGDKLLGGPQAGIIVGRRELVQRLRSHPLARAFRLDKLSVAALAATLVHYLKDEAVTQIPVWRMIATPLESLEQRARELAGGLGTGATVLPGRSMVGGGSLPEESLPTCLLALLGPQPASLASRLRTGTPPVVARIDQDRVLIDPRTVDPRDDAALLGAIERAVAAGR